MMSDAAKKVLKIIWDEEGIDYTGIQAGNYSIHEIKQMLEKALLGDQKSKTYGSIGGTINQNQGGSSCV